MVIVCEGWAVIGYVKVGRVTAVGWVMTVV